MRGKFSRNFKTVYAFHFYIEKGEIKITVPDSLQPGFGIGIDLQGNPAKPFTEL